MQTLTRPVNQGRLDCGVSLVPFRPDCLLKGTCEGTQTLVYHLVDHHLLE